MGEFRHFADEWWDLAERQLARGQSLVYPVFQNVARSGFISKFSTLNVASAEFAVYQVDLIDFQSLFRARTLVEERMSLV